MVSRRKFQETKVLLDKSALNNLYARSNPRSNMPLALYRSRCLHMGLSVFVSVWVFFKQGVEQFWGLYNPVYPTSTHPF